MTYNLDELDRIERMLAEMNGAPLPEARLEGPLKTLVGRAEKRFSVRVRAAPHTFRTGSYGSTSETHAEILLFVHPDYPREASMRTLYHECGHRQQIDEGAYASYDRDTLDGYFDCERDAYRRGWALAGEWGDAALFPEEGRQSYLVALEEALEACHALGTIAGTRNAHVLQAALQRLTLLRDRNLGEGLRGYYRKEEGEGVTPLELANGVWEDPEAFVGFDRAVLRPSWSITTMGPPADALSTRGQERARRWLVEAMRQVNDETPFRLAWRPDPDDRRFRFLGEARDDDGPPTRLVWTDGNQDGIAPFIDVVQAALLQRLETILGLTWNVYYFDEGRVYEAHIEWKRDGQGDEPPADWRVFCKFTEGYSRSAQREDALRLYISSFRHACGIYERGASEMLSTLVWLWENAVRAPDGDRPRASTG